MVLSFSSNSQKNVLDTVALQKTVSKFVDGKFIKGASFMISYGGSSVQFSEGNMGPATTFYIASTTKLFVSALTYIMEKEGQLQLDSPVSTYFPKHFLKGIHVYKGVDYSDSITIKQLLSHTSGLADYFSDKDAHGISWEKKLTSGEDRSWDIYQVLERCRELKPHFKPGAQGKAYYSDVNFQLLAFLLETINKKPLAVLLQEWIITPLAMRDTYLCVDTIRQPDVPLYYQYQPLLIPKAMKSFGGDGGMVSTTHDLMKFLKAWAGGQFFSVQSVTDQFNPIFFPLDSGPGYHRLRPRWYMNPGGKIPILYGHSGLSGTIAYYNAEKQLFITGTVNQVAKPQTSFQCMLRLLQQVLR